MTTKLILSLESARRTSNVIINHVQRRHMPVNVPPTATGKRRFRLAVETDPNKLVNFVCGLNYHIDEPPIELKPESEYPEWLWSLRLHPKKNSWELEFGTKEYYLRLRDEEREMNYIKKMTSDKVKKTVGKILLSNEEYVKRLRFNALAYLDSDAGLDADDMEKDWMETRAKKELEKRRFYLPMNENRVIYMDKIPGNRALKNFYRDEESSFRVAEIRMEKHPSNTRPAIQDSVRRHRYAGT